MAGLAFQMALGLLRLTLPTFLKSYANRQLSKSPDYAGEVGNVRVSLWRGAYRIENASILQRSGRVTSPFFAVRELDLSIEWRELIHGSLTGEVIMREPRINFVTGPTAEQTQTGQGTRWDQMLASLFPFKINRLEIREGEVHFQNPHSTPPVDLSLDHCFATATNLTNARDTSRELPAGVIARGRTLGDGGFAIQVRLDPMASSPAYELTSELTNVNLTALNGFLRAYGKFDVERGSFSLFTSAAAKDGKYEGYCKAFFENLDVFAWEKERKKNAIAVFWQAIVGTAGTIFKNQPHDRLAAKIPFSGSYTNSHVGVWTATATLLRNAFIQALVSPAWTNP